MEKRFLFSALLLSTVFLNTQAQTWNIPPASTGGLGSIGTTSNHPLNVITNNATRMSISNTGNFTLNLPLNGSIWINNPDATDALIGFTTPLQKASMSLALAKGQFSWSDQSKANDVLLINRSHTVGSSLILVNHAYQGSIKFTTKDFSNNPYAWDKLRMEIKYDGKVVIGDAVTSSIANTKLHVNGLTLIGSDPTAAESTAITTATTCSPTPMKLWVNGSIGTKEVRISLDKWCDYVFDADYNLKPLAEVAAYIEKNKHLPEVPSEKELVENGVSMGEMMKIHMRKIEELTLYLIEMQKQNDEIKKQNEQLATQLQELKK